MRRIALALLGTISTLVLLFGYHTSTSAELATTAQAPISSSTSSGSATSNSSGSSTSTGSSGGTGSSGSTGSTGSTAKTTTKTVTGAVASTQWGPVQVKLTVQAGSITQVAVVEYPNGNGKDAEINAHALPILIQETTDQQSASIDMVSGATVTSTGYIQSLQSALDQANL